MSRGRILAKLFICSSLAAEIVACSPPTPPKEDSHTRTADLSACFDPSPQERSCNSIESYEVRSDGNVSVRARVALTANTTMDASYDATLERDAICGGILLLDIDRVRFQVDGRPATAAEQQVIRAGLSTRLRQRADIRECVVFQLTPAGWRARITWNGVEQPQLDQPVRWIDHDAGYLVAARSPISPSQ